MIYDKVVSNGSALGVPGHLSLGQHFLEKIIENCERYGDRIAMINGDTDEEIKYSRLLQDTVNLAIGLKKLGVSRGDVVAFYSESRNEVVPALMAAICCGATVTVFNIIYTKDELRHVLDISKPRLIFCSSSVIEAQLETLKDTKCINTIIRLNGESSVEGVIALKDVMLEGDPRSYEPEAVCGATDNVVILYSSGTTGLPKGVMLTHLNVLYACTSIENGYSQIICDSLQSILPWYHVFGLFTMILSLTGHKRFVYLSGFKPEKYLNTLQKYKAQCLYLVPTVLVNLSKAEFVDQYNMSSVKSIISGAAPLSEDIVKQIKKSMPNLVKFVDGYGLTETTMAVLKYQDEADAESGLLPIPGCKVKVVHTETRQKLGPNKEGEICVKGPLIMKGYVNNEEATKNMFDLEGYLKTGDIGVYNEKGYVSIIDRLKEIIKYKGHQVAPTEIERVILLHSGVLDCGVVGKPDELAGELPTAFVVRKPGGPQVTEEELLEFTSSKVSPLARLRGGIVFVDNIPKNPSGKILRRLLKQNFKQ